MRSKKMLLNDIENLRQELDDIINKKGSSNMQDLEVLSASARLDEAIVKYTKFIEESP